MSALLSVLAWLIGSKAGRITAVLALSGLMIVLAVWLAYRKGLASERTRQTQASLDNLRKRVAINDAVAKLPADKRREELAKWASE